MGALLFTKCNLWIFVNFMLLRTAGTIIAFALLDVKALKVHDSENKIWLQIQL